MLERQTGAAVINRPSETPPPESARAPDSNYEVLQESESTMTASEKERKREARQKLKIIGILLSNPYYPTSQEIGDYLSISPEAVARRIVSLKNKHFPILATASKGYYLEENFRVRLQKLLEEMTDRNLFHRMQTYYNAMKSQKVASYESEKGFTLDPREERKTVAKAQTGDQEAFGVLYRAFSLRVFRYMLGRTRNFQDSEDLREEVFRRAFDALDRFELRQIPFGAWLFTIARNTLISYQRKEIVRYNNEVGGIPVSTRDRSKDSQPEEVTETKLALEEVKKTIQLLPQAQRQVIGLRFGAGLTVAETAKVLKKGEGNVKVIQHKAIVALRRLLGVEPEKGSQKEFIWQGRRISPGGVEVLRILTRNNKKAIDPVDLANKLKISVSSLRSRINSLKILHNIAIRRDLEGAYYLPTNDEIAQTLCGRIKSFEFELRNN